MVEKTLGDILIKRFLFHNELWKVTRFRLPKIRVEFVDINSIVDTFRDKIDLMKKNFFNLEKQSIGIENGVQYVFSPVDKYGAVCGGP